MSRLSATIGQVCGARTSRKNSAGGRPCRMTRVTKSGRCKFHGGFSTGPRTLEGRERIAKAQEKRWREWKAANPRLFPDLKPRQERHIKRLYRQRQALKSKTVSCSERELGENWYEIMEERLREYEAENARARERNKPLTPEQIVEADRFLEHWASTTKQPHDQAREELYVLDSNGYMVRDPGPSPSQQWVSQMLESPTTRPDAAASRLLSDVKVQGRVPADNTAQKLQAQIERQPSHRIKRLEYQDRQEAIQAHGEELIARYGRDPVRPTVKVGHASKKRR